MEYFELHRQIMKDALQNKVKKQWLKYSLPNVNEEWVCYYALDF